MGAKLSRLYWLKASSKKIFYINFNILTKSQKMQKKLNKFQKMTIRDLCKGAVMPLFVETRMCTLTPPIK